MRRRRRRVKLPGKQDATPETRYWLARSLQGKGERVEAKTILQALAAELCAKALTDLGL